MSYGMATALQAAVYQHLLADTEVSNLVGSAIYDAVPAGTLPQTYVTLGAEEVREASDSTGTGALHRFTISVMSEAAGFATAKTLAAAITDALVSPSIPPLSRGRLVGLWFEKAVANRTGSTGQTRRIDLKFRARVEDN
ncbi:DUF3168 domain-containing protein [Phaeobacter sp. NW0010-22]|uniref:DUF3168 domain-containing protein n=1 Tax=Phaeobacter sp. NW0010-22 TaxID=3135907 RepID=UPI0031053D16